jgi:cell division transport system permease protein
MMRALRYAFDEAILSLWRGRQSALLSTGTIAVALFVLGAFLLGTSNLDRLVAEWGRAAEMSVYLDDAATAEDRAALEKLLEPGDVVDRVEFVSKGEALSRFKQTFSDLGSVVDSLEDNPLPASYEVRLSGGASAASDAESLAATLRSASGVADVRFDRQWLDRLHASARLIRIVGFGLAALLTIAAALTVANVIRLALHARQDELEIMELVGAPRAYVQGPFVMEGVLQGGTGALLALGALALLFLAVHGRYLTPLAEAINLSSVRFLSPQMCGLLLAGGMAVGFLGGLIAARHPRTRGEGVPSP